MLRWLLSALLLAAASTPVWAVETLDEALALAQKRNAPVVVDFHAPWCYSCYFMAKHVLVGKQWEDIEHRTVVLQMDADSPEGTDLMKQWSIKGLPNFVVLNPKGEEVGRIALERQKDEFYHELDALLARSSSLDDLKKQAAAGGVDSVSKAGQVLSAYLAREDSQKGQSWYDSLNAQLRQKLDADPKIQAQLAQLRMRKAIEDKDVQACLKEGQQVLAADLGCERAYVFEDYLQCALDSPDRVALLTAQRDRMAKFAEERGMGTDRCADQRSVIKFTVEMYRQIGDMPAQRALLQKAVADLQKRTGGVAGKDRSQDDNLRAYLDMLGDYEQLDAWMHKLIAAYPDEYIYYYREGVSLMERSDPEAALPFLEKAAERAYGSNRLRVAEERVKALKDLLEDEEAKRVGVEALKANGPWFPEEAARLKALIKS